MVVISQRGKRWTSRLAGSQLPTVVAPLILIVGLMFLAMSSVGGTPAMAQDAASDEEPTPSSVDQVVTPMDRAFKEKPPLPRFLPWLKDQLRDTPAFFRDMRLDLTIRTYYFDRERFDDTISEAWALGGALSYQSGWVADRFSVGSVLYTSQKISAPETHDGTLLLKPGQESYTVLGQLYGRVKVVENNFINLYRYEYNTPFINKNDGRMTPNTFEGYTFQGTYRGKEGSPAFGYGGGYITKIKERNSDEFVWMSTDAGADVHRGVALAGGSFSYRGLAFGDMNYYSKDIINIFYTEGSYKVPVAGRLGLLFSAQYIDQRSTGDNLLTGSSFSTNQLGLRSDASYEGAVLTFAYTSTARGLNMQNPWSGYPGYTGVQVQDFNRAGESAFMAKASYDFSRLGLEGVTAYALYVHGWGAIDSSTGTSVTNQNEFDADLQWRPQWKFLKGLRLRTRYANVRQYEGDRNQINDFRVIVNYDIPLL
jgi:hypothetical protein